MTVVLNATAVTKSYGAITALEQGDFLLERGEVHVLLGANGCGKSTLCKIIAGAVQRDAGEITLSGAPLAIRTPVEAQQAGIATVYQETGLVPTLTVADNILLGQEPLDRFGRIDAAAVRRRLGELFQKVGALAEGMDPNALVSSLTIDQQQIVEIIKALSRDPDIIIFDESTSSLDRRQVGVFFDLVRRLKQQGTSMIFISHRMEEVFDIGDKVTVMRNGRSIATHALSATTREELIEQMVGEAMDGGNQRRATSATKEIALRVTNLSGGKVIGADIEVRKGEILGLGGLHGQGQSDFLLALYGGIARRSGEVEIMGQAIGRSTPSSSIRDGLVYISGDRGRAGALTGRPIIENLIIGILSKGRKRFANRSALKKRAQAVVDRLKIKIGFFSDAIETLSGGNQQKIVVGRGMATEPLVFLLDDPTKGIDVQSKRDLFALLGALCDQGVAIILYSSEDMELLDNVDRVLVFNSGHIVAEIPRAELTGVTLNAAALTTAGAHV